MADTILTNDVAAVSWATAPDASARETARDGRSRSSKTRKPSRLGTAEPEIAAPSDEPAHELDSFA